MTKPVDPNKNDEITQHHIRVARDIIKKAKSTNYDKMKQHKKDELTLAILGFVVLFTALYCFVKGIMF